MAAELLKRETLNYTDIEKLLGPPVGSKRKFIEVPEFEASLNSIIESEQVRENSKNQQTNAPQ